MRKLLNTLFVTSEDAYLTIDGENVVVNREKQEVARFPLHTLSGIISFSYAGASPALMGGCARRGVSLSFCTPTGRFLARSVGEENGNVLLRRMQYRAADDPAHSCRIARNMIFGKLHNARWSIERTKRDHALRVDIERLQASIDQIKALYPVVAEELSMKSLRGSGGVGGLGADYGISTLGGVLVGLGGEALSTAGLVLLDGLGELFRGQNAISATSILGSIFLLHDFSSFESSCRITAINI